MMGKYLFLLDLCKQLLGSDMATRFCSSENTTTESRKLGPRARDASRLCFRSISLGHASDC